MGTESTVTQRGFQPGGQRPCLFVIICQGRCGSTLLVELLNSSEEINVDGEILAGGLQQNWPVQNTRLERFVAYPVPLPVRALGFKAKLSDIVDTHAFRIFLRTKGFHVVVLTRADLVKQALSWIYAERLFERIGEWNLVHGDLQFEPIAVNCSDLVQRIRALERGRDALFEFVASCELETTIVRYETLKDSPEAEAKRIAWALGVTPTKQLCATVRKHTPDELGDAVANPEEVRACLTAAGYL